MPSGDIPTQGSGDTLGMPTFSGTARYAHTAAHLDGPKLLGTGPLYSKCAAQYTETQDENRINIRAQHSPNLQPPTQGETPTTQTGQHTPRTTARDTHMSDENTGPEPRNKSITLYYTESEKKAIKREAADAGKTTSAYCRDIIDRSRRADDLAELDAEARLERVMAESTDRVEEIASGIREQNGLVIHLLREIEDDLEGVDVDAFEDDENADRDGVDTADRDDSNSSGKAKSVDDLL